MKTLADIKSGETAIVIKIIGREGFKRRLRELGFVKGREITVVKNAPLKDPIEYRLMGYNISLRRSEAEHIEVALKSELINTETEYHGTLGFLKNNKKFDIASKTINIVFVGNPNAGKTTIFNEYTGMSEHVGNYSGVTVDAKKGHTHFKGYKINMVDLPGTYSMSPNSPEEIYVRDYILRQHPDIVINVLDASNLERNLFLTTQLIDMDVNVIIALNMFDELEKKGDELKYDLLAKLIGIPIVPTIGSKNQGLGLLKHKIVEVFERKETVSRHIHLNYGEELEKSINKIQKQIWKDRSFTDEFSSRYFALKLLEKDEHTFEQVKESKNAEAILKTSENEVTRLENEFNDDAESLIADARYGFISGALKSTYQIKNQKSEKLNNSQKIDRILTGKYTGFPIFLLFLYVMFQSTFTLGQYPADWIDSGIGWLGNFIENIMSDGPVRDLLAKGVIGGVGGVLVFLPNIVILFFFIAIMETTGYMARVAFIMDKLMHLIGLHGKSFIPLIMGFGCNVPAIMSTRTLENKNDRLLTMLILPFMSCSARLPVYILVAGAIFKEKAGIVIFSIYIAGIIISILTALFLKKTMLKKKDTPFVMELPPYRIPTFKATVFYMWSKVQEYLKKMGGIILWASIIIWFLGYYPRNNEQIDSWNNEVAQFQEEIKNNPDHDNETHENIEQLQKQIVIEQQQNSYLGRMGKFIEPAIMPLGFDWKMGISLLSGIAAKEVVVSTLGVIYAGDSEATEGSESLIEAIQNQKHENGKLKGSLVYTPAASLAFLVFVLIYVPCIAVIAAIKKESGQWKWALWSIGYSTALAYVLAFITHYFSSIIL